MSSQVSLSSPSTNAFFRELENPSYKNFKEELIAYFKHCNGDRAAFYRNLLSKLSDYHKDVVKIMQIYDCCFAPREELKVPVLKPRQHNGMVFERFDFDYSAHREQDSQQNLSDLEFAEGLCIFPRLAFAVSRQKTICIYDACMHVNNYLKEKGDLKSINLSRFLSWLK